MVTDLPSSFNTSFLNICGYEMSKRAAERCFGDAGMSIRDVDVIEVHDCFAPNEVTNSPILQPLQVMVQKGKFAVTRDKYHFCPAHSSLY